MDRRGNRGVVVSNEYMELPVDIIYCDKEFNCRANFTPQSCLDLAQSIKQHGLQFPVVVQPVEDTKSEIPSDFSYRLIIGHRRFIAITQLLGWDTIPVQVKKGLEDQQVKILNLIENLERKSITLLDEANAIHSIFPEGTSWSVMARETSKSTGWCKVRWSIPTLPEEIQQDCAAGRLETTDISLILGTDDKHRIALAREIKIAKGRGESVRRRLERFTKMSRKVRNRAEIHVMLAHLMSEGIKPSPYRALAWAAGDLTEEAFLEELE